MLCKLKYQYALSKKEKGLVLSFLKQVTGYSDIQIKRLIKKYKKGKLYCNHPQNRQAQRKYSQEDVSLLHNVDNAHMLSGNATKKILEREYEIFGDLKYKNLSQISVSHIYNLRKSKEYQTLGRIFDKTKSKISNIGIRRKPNPEGRPGFLRVDSVHQGDLGKEKGVYWINIVDEVTQAEFVYAVPAISEKYMKEVLEKLMKDAYFKIINFHSDNGSEYINKVVANLLNKLHINQTKSRARKSNDNALVEGKNAAIVRKEFGHFHIPATEENAKKLNEFCHRFLNPYLNFHRPCAFPRLKINKQGKEKKHYYQEDYSTPYEKFKSLKEAEKYLKEDRNFNYLDKIAYSISSTEFKKIVNKKKDRVLNEIFRI